MAIFATFDDGVPTGFYDEAVHGARILPVYGDYEEPSVPTVIGHIPNPDTLIPVDAIEITVAQRQDFIDNPGERRWSGNNVEPWQVPAPAPTVADYSAAIQAHLDAKARERQYDGIQTAVSYCNDPNPMFAEEAEALFAWRSAVWTYSTTELAKVQSGERTAPSIETFMQELPAFSWPS